MTASDTAQAIVQGLQPLTSTIADLIQGLHQGRSDHDSKSHSSEKTSFNLSKAEKDDKGYEAKCVRFPKKVDQRIPNMCNIKGGDLRNLELWEEFQTSCLLVFSSTYTGSDIGANTWQDIMDVVNEAIEDYKAAATPSERHAITTKDSMSRYQKELCRHLWDTIASRSPEKQVKRVQELAKDAKALPRIEELIFRIAIICLPYGRDEKEKLRENFEESRHFKRIWSDFLEQIRSFKRDLKLLEDYHIFDKQKHDYSKLFRRNYNDIFEGDLPSGKDQFRMCLEELSTFYDRKYMSSECEDQIPREEIDTFLDKLYDTYAKIKERGAISRDIWTKSSARGRREERDATPRRGTGERSPTSGVWRYRSPSRDRQSPAPQRVPRSNERGRSSERQQNPPGRGRDSPGRSQKNVRQATRDGDDDASANGGHDVGEKEHFCWAFNASTGKNDFRPLREKPKGWNDNNCCIDRDCPGRKQEKSLLSERKCKHIGEGTFCSHCDQKGHNQERCYGQMPWILQSHRDARSRNPGSNSRKSSVSSSQRAATPKRQDSPNSRKDSPRGSNSASANGGPQTPRSSQKGAQKEQHKGDSPRNRAKSPSDKNKRSTSSTSSFQKGVSGHPSPRK